MADTFKSGELLKIYGAPPAGVEGGTKPTIARATKILTTYGLREREREREREKKKKEKKKKRK